MTVLYHLDRVAKLYGERTVLAPVSFSLEAGRSLGIIGESGSGKTTLTRIMLGLLKPSGGTVVFRGEPVRFGVRGVNTLRREVQVVLQDPFASLNPRMTVAQIVAEPLHILGRSDAAEERVLEVLAQVQLEPGVCTRFPHQLSGGQRQRVAIARALAQNPSVIVADEPVSALDVSVRMHILEVLQTLRAQGITFVVVSHDLGIVQHLCDDTMVLANGHCVEYRPTEDLLKSPHHPTTQELLAAVPELPV